MARHTVAEAGERLGGDASPDRAPRLPSIANGLIAAGALLGFYVGVITLAQSWQHAIQQLADDRWFVAVIAAGFGAQVGLFSYVRARDARIARGGVAASTGTSTTAMLACCAHHLADVLPIVGLSGAAIFLEAYKTPLLWLGIAMNLVGVVYLLRLLPRTAAWRPAERSAQTPGETLAR